MMERGIAAAPARPRQFVLRSASTNSDQMGTGWYRRTELYWHAALSEHDYVHAPREAT